MLATPEQRMQRTIATSRTEVRFTRRAVAGPTFDPATGDLVEAPPDEVYAGPALVNFINIRERDTQRAGEAESESRFQVSVPLSAGPFRLGDQCEITCNDSDPQLEGRKLWVAQIPAGSAMARRRLYCSVRQVEPR